ncbi:MAG: hypothetical protein B7Y39_10545 [Bdellovibrio sp. 28-41-41]|nr:MAG: hypothetical protein B7Y39_10545 [Bdellovibrio sp. 28-41-41]
MKNILLLGLVLFIGISSAHAKKIDFYENSTLHYYNGLYVLDLHGSREEMMRAHGFFAAKNIQANSPIQFFSSVMDKALDEKFNSKLGVGVVSGSLDVLLKMKMSKEDQKAYSAFAQGMNVPAKQVFKALYYPDFGEMLASVQYGKNETAIQVPEFGCSTFVAPKSTQNPGLLFGRNLEFGGVGYFDRYPAVVYLHSTDPKDIPYVQMTALGLPGTHTAYNQSGLMISLHQLTANQLNPVGDLILNVVDEVARRAHNLTEARQIIQSKKFTTPWKIIVASESDNSGFLAEVSPKGEFFHELQGSGLGESNHAVSKEIKSDEFFANYNYIQSSIMRKAALHDALDANKVIDADSAMNLLGQRTQPVTGSNSFISLSKFSNIMSVVVSAKDHTLYYGLASRINTKPSSGVYVKLPLDFKTDFATYEAAVHQPSVVYDAALLDVDHHVRAAMTESNQKGDITVIAKNLKKAVEAYSMDAGLNSVYAATLLKLFAATEGKSEQYLTEAQAVLEYSKAVFKGENDKAIHLLLLARIAVLKNNQNEAVEFYKNIVPTSSQMKMAIASDMKVLKSNDARKSVLEKSKKVKITLSDLDIVSFQ